MEFYRIGICRNVGSRVNNDGHTVFLRPPPFHNDDVRNPDEATAHLLR
ncbi:hypothetical protein TPY_1403 [Sulfobacillus acidophilus TPY]|nr:hypothetical protein TPY_1403 [Sulfobacillus acidophilus TPY]